MWSEAADLVLERVDTFAYDTNGNLVREDDGSGVWTYTYDYEDRLVVVSKDGVVLASYAYDALGRRNKAVESATTTYTMYQGLASMYTWTGDASSVPTDYVYGAGLLIANISGSTVQYFHSDALGSTRLVTDAAATRVFETYYRPFGQEYGTTGSDPAYRFTGEKRDAANGLYYLHARHYDPKTGRFLQPDSILGALSAPQTLNRYPYIVNNPLRYVDPEGLKTTGRDPRAYAGARLGMGCIEDCEIDWRALGDVLFTAIGFLPVVGDIAATAWFLAWDAYDCLTVGCNWANIGLDALGILPGVPNLGGGARVFARIGAVVPLPFLGGLVRHGDEAVELARGAGRGVTNLDSRVWSYISKGDTTGVLRIGDDVTIARSGQRGFAQALPKGYGHGFDTLAREHAEGHLLAYMRARGARSAVLDLGSVPCSRCTQNIPHMLLPGAILDVRAPFYHRVFRGLG